MTPAATAYVYPAATCRNPMEDAMSEYYQVDVDGDGRLDDVEVTEYEDGSAIALVDVDNDGYADYEIHVTATGEVEGPYEVSDSTDPVDAAIERMVIESQINMARVWADLPPLEDDETSY
jgi:hypothetical protein